jgi:integrase
MTKRDGLPTRVYLKHSSYYYVDHANKWHRLSAERQGLPAMYRALADLTDHAEARATLAGVAQDWLKAKSPGWSAARKREATHLTDLIIERMGSVQPADVTAPIAAAMLAEFRDRASTHNKVRATLKILLDHAALIDLREGVNPLAVVPGLSTPGRKRIVTDAELSRLRAACNTDSPHASGRALVQMIELALLTGQRIGDLIKLRWQDVSEAGVYVEQGKTGTRLLIEWTPDLIAAIESCAAGRDRVGHVLVNRWGAAYTYNGILGAWSRACKRAGITDLHIHDLRGRAGVDVLEDRGIEAARQLLGHTTQRQTAHYTGNKTTLKVKPSR